MKRTRQAIGVVAVGALALGLYLGGLFKGLGWGGPSTGSGVGDTLGVVSTEGQPTGRAIPAATTENQIAATAPPPAVATVIREPVLHVLIDGANYLLRESAKTAFRTPMSAVEVAQLAAQADGDVDGVKVRILRTADARAKTEQALAAALEEAGVPRTAIDLSPATYVPGETTPAPTTP